jgi:hypothetical protein
MLQSHFPRPVAGEQRGALCRPAQQDALRQRIGKDCAWRYHDRLTVYNETSIGAVIVTTMLDGSLRRISITARQRSILELDGRDSSRRSTEYQVAAFTEGSHITARVHQTRLATRSFQCLNRAIDGVTLGDASEIKAQPSARPDTLRLDELEVAHPSWRTIQTRVKCTAGAFVQLVAELQYFPGPGVYLQRGTDRARGERCKVATSAVRMHDALDCREGIEGCIDRSLCHPRLVRLDLDRDESPERNA